jgi:DNA-directed RNA polymerase subunit RPC12/RpoP
MNVTVLDGNAIASLLHDVFGAEMTTANCVCAGCGMTFLVAESEVYRIAPGTVVRCRSCGGVLMVLVTIRELTCVDLRGLAELEPELRPT